MAMLQCPDCRGELRDLQCVSCHRAFEVRDGIPVLLSATLDALKHDEAKYHDHFDEDAREAHQLGAVRNRYYHGKIQRAVCPSPHPSPSEGRGSNCRILEVGGGNGYDAEELMKRGAEVTVTDISVKTLLRTRERLQRLSLRAPMHTEGRSNLTTQVDYEIAASPSAPRNDSVRTPSPSPSFIVADAEHLPFADACFDSAYAVAVVHHMPTPDRAVAEMARVVRPGGRVVVGMEPNATYFRAVRRLRPLLCRAVGQSPHEGSRADAEMEGFTEKELRRAFANVGLAVERVIPVWFTLGFLHYGLEFLHRALRLRHRIVVPQMIEWLFLVIDRLLFLIPGMRRLGWHWIVAGRKNYHYEGAVN